MPRIFIPSVPEAEIPVALKGEEARYVLAVLRMRAGEELSLVDPRGGLHRARIERAGGSTLQLRVLESLPPRPEPGTGVVLLQGILKGGKMDLVIQKATELGVREIVPFVTERSQVRDTRKLSRWRKVALEAARQCGRAAVPSVREPVPMKDFFRGSERPLKGFIFWEEGGRPLSAEPLKDSEEDVLVAVGPEGGFTKEEAQGAEGRGLTVSTLGPLILRAETAAIAAVTLVQFLMRRMGDPGGD